MKRNYIIFLISLLCLNFNLSSGQTSDKISISGIVMDEKGAELPGVSIFVKESSAIRATTDREGRFTLRNLEKGNTVIFRFIGFSDYQYLVTGTKEKLRIGLKENVSALKEIVVVGHGTQRKVTTTGAVTTVNVADLQVPATSVSNMLSGRVPGIVGVLRSGEPGKDFSEFWIRGISTFGASSAALVLIDGVEGDLNNIDPVDIESFSILKDASATAVYGIRGANGVVIITTKRGKAGPLKVNVKANNTLSHSARMPNYVGSYDYAVLANEARLSRGQNPIYTGAELELFNSGLDPDLYPNVKWRDVILSDYTRAEQYNLNITGGGTNARYYMSMGYINKQGLFNMDENASKYDANTNYKKLNFRANVDVDLTKTTKLGLNLDDAWSRNNTPGVNLDSRALWAAQASITPVSVPVQFSNGQLAAYGANGSGLTPYYLLNYTGYNKFSENAVNVKLNLDQKLDSLVKGLSARALFSLTYTSELNATLQKTGAEAFRAIGRANDGSLVTSRTITQSTNPLYAQPTSARRQTYMEARLDYNRSFNQAHNVTGLIHVYRQEDADSEAAYSISSQNVVPVRYQAISARATYGFKDTYLFEANVGISGSENFKPGEQYGIFPALSAGWVPSNYNWWKDKLSFVNFFKIRGSWGKVGNASIRELVNGAWRAVRFPYQTIVSPGSSDWGGSLTELRLGTENLRWQTSTKYDLGTDVNFFHSRFELKADAFYTQAKDIYQQRITLPEEVGAAQNPWLNTGAMDSWGFDGNLSYNQKVGKDFDFTLRSNLTFSRNKVTHWEQSGINFPYQSFTGVPYGVQRGLIALGLFKDQDDINSSPSQTFMNNYLPGDIKYKDVNNDGIINTDDVVPLNYSDVPRWVYGFAASANWKKWGFNVFFTGQAQANYFLGGAGYYPFMAEDQGNLLSIVSQGTNRWIPASISGDPSTENPNARFPRLTYGANANNNRASTFWMADASFFRLKNAEISYRINGNWLKSRTGISSISLHLIGDNLKVWDKVKLWDPEQASSNGAVYPLQRTYTLQMYLNF